MASQEDAMTDERLFKESRKIWEDLINFEKLLDKANKDY